jgi:hypothetical protein
MNDESSAMAQPYEIVSVRRAEPPLGADGSNWRHYVIAFQGSTRIHGYRQGDLTAVKRAVEEIIAKLNERHRAASHAVRKPARVDLVLMKKTHK